jgi:hypothetical protein
MAIGTLRRSRKTKLLDKATAEKKEYAKHYAKAGKNAMTFAQWQKQGKESVYFRNIKKKKTVEARMREAGMTLKRSRSGK